MHTKKLVEFLTNIRYDDLSTKTIENTKMYIEDTISGAIAANSKPATKIWNEFASEFESKGNSTLWSPGFKNTDYMTASYLNSAYAHMLDIDDVHNLSITHLGAVTIPTALAMGQHYHISGKKLIEAIVAGYEVGARIGEAVNPSSFKMWHTTAIVGPFCAAAVACKILNLNAEQMKDSFGSAGAHSSGVWEFMTDGAMTKSLHTAKSAVAGISSAKLAALGFTGANRILEGDRGIVAAISPYPRMKSLTDKLGEGYKLDENSVKPYASCRHTHSSIYAISQLMEKHSDIETENIRSIEVKTYSIAITMTDNAKPANTYAHKFSNQYCIAAMLTYGNVLEKVFTEERINNSKIKQLMEVIKMELDEEIEKEFTEYPDRWIHKVDVTTKEGRLYSKTVVYPIGDTNNPFTWEMYDQKFIDLNEDIIPMEQIKTICNNIKSLENLEDINEIFEFYTKKEDM